MAKGKKSFIAYSDWKDVFDELPNEEAGQLIKHIFAYVNDENPQTDNILIKSLFAMIKSTLKRDLNKWETQLNQRSEAGKKSAEKRALKNNERNSTTVERPLKSVDETERNSTVSVSVSVNDNVDIISIKEKNLKKVEEVKNYFEQTNFDNTMRVFETNRECLRDSLNDFLEVEYLQDNFVNKTEPEILKHFRNWLKFNNPKKNAVKDTSRPNWILETR